MSLAEYWSKMFGAPIRRRAAAASAVMAALAAAASLGVPQDRYLFEWQEAITHCPELTEGVPSRAFTSRSAREPGQARLSNVVQVAQVLRSFLFDPKWPIFTARIERIAARLGVKVRHARTLMRQCEIAGLVVVVHRWHGLDHAGHRERRTNLYILAAPAKAWEAYAAWRASELGEEDEGAEGEPEPETTPQASPAPPQRRAERSPAARPASAPAARRAGRPAARPASVPAVRPASVPAPGSWFAELFYQARGADRRYAGDADGGTTSPQNLERVEGVFEGFAADCRRWAFEKGWGEPKIDAAARALAAYALRAWLNEPGKSTEAEPDGVLVSRRHPIGLFQYDARRCGSAAIGEWKRQWKKDHPRPPVVVSNESTPAVDAAAMARKIKEIVSGVGRPMPQVSTRAPRKMFGACLAVEGVTASAPGDDDVDQELLDRHPAFWKVSGEDDVDQELLEQRPRIDTSPPPE